MQPLGYVNDNIIYLHKRWLKALNGIDGFSHIIVIFWLNKARKPELKIHPKGIKQIPKIGFLATRTPHRFNPIGVTVVKLLKHKGRKLWVKDLDAWNKTPIIDIKPYTKRESVKNFRIPKWVYLMDKLETDPLRKYGGQK